MYDKIMCLPGNYLSPHIMLMHSPVFRMHMLMNEKIKGAICVRTLY